MEVKKYKKTKFIRKATDFMFYIISLILMIISIPVITLIFG